MAQGIKTVWTPDMDNYLIENYNKISNQQLADHFGYTLTVTRNQLRKLGLKRITMEYWTAEQISYLLAKYKTTGNVEIAKYLNKNHPKEKKWTKRHINKKMGYLKISRTPAELDAINADTNAIRLNVALLKKQTPGSLKKYKIPELRIEIFAKDDEEFKRKREKIINRDIDYNAGSYTTTTQPANRKQL